MLSRVIKGLAPPLTHEAHKGQAGRIGVVGGSIEYTGAPYFSAMTAMRMGADLGHIFCQKEAAPVIKSYSPDLIVHPLLSSDVNSCNDIAPWLSRLHAIVIGPGLGRDPGIMNTVKSVIEEAKRLEKDIVIDADGLHLITQDPQIITGYTQTILTPNVAEFSRLYEKILGHPPSGNDGTDEEQTKKLASAMCGVTILRKGRVDVISNGVEGNKVPRSYKILEDLVDLMQVIMCAEEGVARRQGGQGDLLSGAIGLLSYWAKLQQDRIKRECNVSPSLVAAYGGCVLVKTCAAVTFQKYGRGMLSNDMIGDIGQVATTLLAS